MRTARFLLVALLALLARAPVASAAATADEVITCMEGNLPQKTIIQTVEFRARDRLGAERTIRAKVYGKRFDDGLRRVLTHFYEPADIRGAGMLILEKGDRNELFLYTPELRKTRRVSAHSAAGSLFGTDFSYEDFERLQGLHTRAKASILPDTVLWGRPVYVLAFHPPPEDESIYQKVLLFIDKKTCVVLKADSYEAGDQLRKTLTTDPSLLVEEGGIWVAPDVLMKDLRDETQTRLIIEEIEVGTPIPNKRFRLIELERSRE